MTWERNLLQYWNLDDFAPFWSLTVRNFWNDLLTLFSTDSAQIWRTDGPRSNVLEFWEISRGLLHFGLFSDLNRLYSNRVDFISNHPISLRKLSSSFYDLWRGMCLYFSKFLELWCGFPLQFGLLFETRMFLWTLISCLTSVKIKRIVTQSSLIVWSLSIGQLSGIRLNSSIIFVTPHSLQRNIRTLVTLEEIISEHTAIGFGKQNITCNLMLAGAQANLGAGGFCNNTAALMALMSKCPGTETNFSMLFDIQLI